MAYMALHGPYGRYDRYCPSAAELRPPRCGIFAATCRRVLLTSATELLELAQDSSDKRVRNFPWRSGPPLADLRPWYKKRGFTLAGTAAKSLTCAQAGLKAFAVKLPAVIKPSYFWPNF